MVIEFSKVAREKFDNIAKAYALLCTQSNERLVRYENDRAKMSICFDNGRSYELAIELGAKLSGGEELLITLSDAIELHGQKYEHLPKCPMASSAAEVSSVLSLLSGVVEDIAPEYLTGVQQSYKRVYEHVRGRADQYEIENKLRLAVAAADEAWINKRYSEVVDALGAIEKDLSIVMRAKLNYARRKID